MEEILSMTAGFRLSETEPNVPIPFADPSHEEIMIELYRCSPLVWIPTFQEFQITIRENGSVESKGFIQPKGLKQDICKLAEDAMRAMQNIRSFLYNNFPYKEISKHLVAIHGKRLESFTPDALHITAPDLSQGQNQPIILGLQDLPRQDGSLSCVTVPGLPIGFPLHKWANGYLYELFQIEISEEMNRQGIHPLLN